MNISGLIELESKVAAAAGGWIDVEPGMIYRAAKDMRKTKKHKPRVFGAKETPGAYEAQKSQWRGLGC
ncbi:MAG: hypothetical protein ACU0CA_09965 [Paracoccaceae bacterium]